MSGKQEAVLHKPHTGIVPEGRPSGKPPFLSKKKKLLITDEELDAFYTLLRKYYHLSHPYDRKKVASEEACYRAIARLSHLFANLKRATVLNEDRVIPRQSTIYTSNHIGSFDQFYIAKALGYTTPLHYLVKQKVTRWPIRWNLIYKPTGVVVVDTASISSWKQAKAKLIQYLLNGGNVFIFAEGSRRGENNAGEFSSGVAQIAQDAGCNVCTLALKNTVSLFSKNPIICVGDILSIDTRKDIKVATEQIKSSVMKAYQEILEYESGCK